MIGFDDFMCVCVCDVRAHMDAEVTMPELSEREMYVVWMWSFLHCRCCCRRLFVEMDFNGDTKYDNVNLFKLPVNNLQVLTLYPQHADDGNDIFLENNL